MQPIRTQAPATAQLSVKIPYHLQRPMLANGMECILLPFSHTELIRLDFYFPGGRWTQHQPLQAQFAFSQMKSGTRSFNAEQIADRIDFYGASLGMACNVSYAYLSLTCLRSQLRELLPMLYSILTEPVYEQHMLDIAIQQSLSGWQVNEKKVESKAQELFYATLFGEQHPNGRITRRTDFEAISRELLLDYHAQHISSKNCTLLLTGNVSDSELKLIEATFGREAWGASDAQAQIFRHELEPAKAQGNRLHHTMEHSTMQTAIRMGQLIPAESWRDAAYLRLTNTIIGGYFGSRLMSNIREEKGYTYDIHSRLLNTPFERIFLIATEVPNASAELACLEITKELERVASEPISQAELANVKNYIAGDSCRSLELNMDTPVMLMQLLSTHRTLADVEHDMELIQSATPEDICRTASQYFKPDTMMICTAG